MTFYLSTATDFANYDEPYKRTVGVSQELVLNLDTHSTLTINFEQLVVRTNDGLVSRKVDEKKAMQFKNTAYRTKQRSLTDPFLSVEFEVLDEMMLVDRIYPSIFDLFAKIGGLVKVLVIVCIQVGMLHNQVLLNKHSLDLITLPDDIEPERIKNDFDDDASSDQIVLKAHPSSQFSYWETLKFTFGIASKSNPRKVIFDKKRNIFA